MIGFKYTIVVVKHRSGEDVHYECETIEDVGPKMIDLLSVGAIEAYDRVSILNNETGETIA